MRYRPTTKRALRVMAAVCIGSLLVKLFDGLLPFAGETLSDSLRREGLPSFLRDKKRPLCPCPHKPPSLYRERDAPAQESMRYQPTTKRALLVMAAVFIGSLLIKLLDGLLFAGETLSDSLRREGLPSFLRDKERPLCPCPHKPPSLLGFRPIKEVDKPMSQLERELGPLLRHGGHYSPPDCRPQDKTAILIPCRNRWSHLRVLLNYLVHVLIRQQLDFTIFVIESDQRSTFNKGILLNLAVLEAMKRDRYTCFVVQDVDLLTLDDRNLYRCGQQPRHLAAAVSKFHYTLPYPRYVGGVYALTLEQLLKVNGHSNLFFGWGGEDDDIQFRLNHVGYTYTRNPEEISKYWMIKHERDKGNEQTAQSFLLIKGPMSVRRMFHEGLNTTRYHLDFVKETSLFTWIKATINQTEVLQSVPPYLQDLYEQGLKFIEKKPQ